MKKNTFYRHTKTPPKSAHV